MASSTVRTFSAIAELPPAHDITLDQLRLELLHPADPESASAFEVFG